MPDSLSADAVERTAGYYLMGNGRGQLESALGVPAKRAVQRVNAQVATDDDIAIVTPRRCCCWRWHRSMPNGTDGRPLAGCFADGLARL